MRKIEIWDILFWIGMTVLVGFIVAKLLGLINTPEWINLIPLVTITFLIGVFYQKVYNFMERTERRMDYLKNKLDNHDGRLASLENK